MAEVTPLYMDISNAYSGDEMGLPFRDIMGEGVRDAGDLAVSAGAGNSVDIAKGQAWVVGDTNPDRQPTYRVFNDAVVNRGINPDPANPRRVLVVAQLTDETFAGVGRNWELQAIHGAPAAAPVLPATPASALALADVLVPAAAASSAAYTVTDLRRRAGLGGQVASRGVRAFNSVAINAPTGVNTLVTFNSERYDFDGLHDVAVNPSRFVARTAGIYDVFCTLNLGQSANGTIRQLLAQVNGAPGVGVEIIRDQKPPAGIGLQLSLSTTYFLNAGDYVEFYVFHDAGAGLSINALGNFTPEAGIARRA